mgnify:CR=1 FL=1
MKQIIVLVGLPARGKSFISNKLYKYLNWINIKTKIFNVGELRRNKYKFTDSLFFDPNNEKNNKIRLEITNELYNDLLNWLLIEDNNIAIFDATNCSIEKRKLLCDMTPKNINILFIESICNIPSLIHKNILIKQTSGDYNNKHNYYDDFLYRIELYKKVYNTVNRDENIRFIKIFNINEQLILNLNSIITNYDRIIINNLLNININRKKIYLSRHGESIYNLENKIGGNSNLSEKGNIYAVNLSKYINTLEMDYIVYCSTLIRTINTAKNINDEYRICKCLDEINAGVCEHKTYDEIKKIYPEEFENRDKDKLNYRYPSGESYIDLIDRLKEFMYDIENNKKDVIIIAHQAILRVIYGYLMGIEINKIPHIKMGLNTLIELTPDTYNFTEKCIKF